MTRDHVDLPPGQAARGEPRLPAGPDRLGGRAWRWATACRTPRRRWASSSWPSSPAACTRTDDVPLWVIVAAATAIARGTYSGGMRIMRTLGRRIIELDPPHGFAAEATAAIVLYVMAIGLHAPVSTTHTITSAVMGAGATKRFSAVRWGVAQQHRHGVDRHDPGGRRRRRGVLLPRASVPAVTASRSPRSILHHGRGSRSEAERGRPVSRTGPGCRPRWPGRRGWRRSSRWGRARRGGRAGRRPRG